MRRQYVVVRFRPNDRRTYTYHFDGAELWPGDEVKVPAKSGDRESWQRVTVASVAFDKPDFTTKAILGLVVKPTAGDLLRDMDEDVQSLMDRDRE